MRFSIAKLGCAHLYTWLAYHAYAPAYTRGCAVLIPVVISRPTPLILRWRLRCPDGKRTSQLYTLSGLQGKLAHNKLSVNTVNDVKEIYYILY